MFNVILESGKKKANLVIVGITFARLYTALLLSCYLLS